MRKIIALIMTSVMALSFAACDSGNTTPPTTEQQKEEIRKSVPPVRSELYDEYNSKLADIDYEYDDTGNCLSHTVTWTDYYGGDAEKTVYTYDDRGNIVHKETSYSYRENYTYNEYFVYDEENRLIEENWGSDFRHIYEYDSDGHLARKMNKNEDGTTNETIRYECDSQGRTLKEISEYDGWTFVYRYNYDSDNRLVSIDYSVNGEVLFSHGYEYDSEGRLTKQGVSIESWKMEGYVTHYYR